MVKYIDILLKVQMFQYSKVPVAVIIIDLNHNAINNKTQDHCTGVC